MQKFKNFLAFFAEEWLMSLSLVGIVIVSLSLGTLPCYTPDQLIPIFLLWALFVAVRGIEQSGILTRISLYLEHGSMLAPKLVVISFLLSLILSIDVTLVTLLPLVLGMQIKERDHLFLLVAFSAHIGAALTPFGTPQNLFIFSFYQLEVIPFIQVMTPFSLGLFALFLLTAFLLPITRTNPTQKHKIRTDLLQGLLYLLTLTVVVLAVLRICPWYAGFIALLSALLFDKNALKVDYPLLFTFLLFLGLANELKSVLAHYIEHPTHIFLLSSLLSQIISNVPSTLLLHQFTPEWEALLWGTNVGGFGTPVAALANLITYRIYAAQNSKTQNMRFLLQMILWGFVVYTLGLFIFWLSRFFDMIP